MDSFVTIEKNNSRLKLKARIIESIDSIKPLANKKAWLIFKELSKRESYPAEIAKKLGLGQQEAYYYMNKLKAAGLVKIAKKEEKQGGLAKFYSATDNCFALVPALSEINRHESFSAITGEEKSLEKNIKSFFEPFISQGELNAKIIVGAPDSHGEFRARARDAHLAVELAGFLGTLAKKSRVPLVYLDTTIRNLKDENSNLIIIGGPITNSLSSQANQHLSISFKQKNAQWIIESENSGKEFTEDNIGIVEKIKHPFFESRHILFIAGKRNAGTRAAILSIIQNTEEIAKPNTFNEKKTAHIVEGLDLDSDGEIDSVELKE
ncbi:MAG: S-layer protein [Candidatus Diapherotrites archaeon]